LRTGNPKAALNELRATVYLNPEAVAPLSAIEHDPALLGIQNAYIQALRETMLTKTATAVRSPAAAAARRAALQRLAVRHRESRSLRAGP
jgi:hypothetical protein